MEKQELQLSVLSVKPTLLKRPDAPHGGAQCGTKIWWVLIFDFPSFRLFGPLQIGIKLLEIRIPTPIYYPGWFHTRPAINCPPEVFLSFFSLAKIWKRPFQKLQPIPRVANPLALHHFWFFFLLEQDLLKSWVVFRVRPLFLSQKTFRSSRSPNRMINQAKKSSYLPSIFQCWTLERRSELNNLAITGSCSDRGGQIDALKGDGFCRGTLNWDDVRSTCPVFRFAGTILRA